MDFETQKQYLLRDVDAQIEAPSYYVTNCVIPRKWDGAICGLRRASPGSGWAGCGAGLEGAPA